MPTSHVRHPVPVNQFYRLDYDEVAKRYVKTTRWNHAHPNANGVLTYWDGFLCMAGEGAVALDAHTGGAIRSTPGAIHDRQSDNLGGIGVDDVADAFATHGQTLLTPDNVSRYDVIAYLRERRHVAIGVDYGSLPYELRLQQPGDFDHAIGLDDLSGDQVFRYDTLDTNPRWKPLEAYLDAAEALALRVRGTKGRLFVGVTRVRPALTAIVEYRVVISGYTPLYSAPNGTKLGAVSKATYICTRSKVAGLWWYQILTKPDGTATANKGRWFKPNRYTEASYD